MALFVVSHESSRDVAQVWSRVTDWAAHAPYVPLTTIQVTTPGPNRVGSVFVAHTGIGRAGFDDPMEVTEWQPPAGSTGGRCRLEKRGRVVRGWAEITVEPSEQGSRAVWREDISVAHLPRVADRPIGLSSRRLFERVLRGLIEA